MELSYFGAKVLHSATIAPAVARRIPILIKNTFNPSRAGNAHLANASVDDGKLAKGITSVGRTGAADAARSRAWSACPASPSVCSARSPPRRVNVVLISQASSEHTICFGVRSADAAAAVEAIEQEFQFELHEQLMRSRRQARPGDSGGGRRRDEGASGRGGKGVRFARPPEHQHQRDRAGRLRAQHLVRHRRRRSRCAR